MTPELWVNLVGDVIAGLSFIGAVYFGVRSLNSASKDREATREERERDRDDARLVREEAREQRFAEWQRNLHAEMRQWQTRWRAERAADVADEAISWMNQLNDKLRRYLTEPHETGWFHHVLECRELVADKMHRLTLLLGTDSQRLVSLHEEHEQRVVALTDSIRTEHERGRTPRKAPPTLDLRKRVFASDASLRGELEMLVGLSHPRFDPPMVKSQVAIDEEASTCAEPASQTAVP